MKIIKFLFTSIILLLSLSSKSQSSDSERIMIDEINLARTNPKLYKEYIIDFVNNNINYKKISQTTEYVKEILSILDTLTPLKALSFDDNVYKAIGDNKMIDTINNTISHDYNELGRIKKYNKEVYVASENIIQGNMIYSYTKIEKYTMRECIVRLLIDWGVLDRGHRNTILSDEYNTIAVKGVSIGNSVWYVQDFTRKN